MMNVERVAAILILLMLPATVGATEKVYTNADLKPEERVSAVSKPHVVFADVKNYDRTKAGYLSLLLQRIESRWAFSGGIHGVVRVRFEINRDGTLRTISIVRASSNRFLDRSALLAVKNASPFWPLPKLWNQDSLQVTADFDCPPPSDE
jgi:TonB family protein